MILLDCCSLVNSVHVCVLCAKCMGSAAGQVVPTMKKGG